MESGMVGKWQSNGISCIQDIENEKKKLFLLLLLFLTCHRYAPSSDGDCDQTKPRRRTFGLLGIFIMPCDGTLTKWIWWEICNKLTFDLKNNANNNKKNKNERWKWQPKYYTPGRGWRDFSRYKESVVCHTQQLRVNGIKSARAQQHKQYNKNNNIKYSSVFI